MNYLIQLLRWTTWFRLLRWTTLDLDLIETELHYLDNTSRRWTTLFRLRWTWINELLHLDYWDKLVHSIIWIMYYFIQLLTNEYLFSYRDELLRYLDYWDELQLDSDYQDELLDSHYWDELLDLDYWDQLLDSHYWDELHDSDYRDELLYLGYLDELLILSIERTTWF